MTKLVVCSAGNANVNTDINSHDPSGTPLDNVISVAATDGDGKDDALIIRNYNKCTYFDVALSNSTKLSLYSTWYNSSRGGMDYNNIKERITVGDFNGDGKDDVAAMYDYGSGTMRVFVFISTGAKFNTESVWRLDTAFYAEKTNGRFAAGDFNGDGKDNIATMYDFGNGVIRTHMLKSSGSSFTSHTWFQSNPRTFNATSVANRFIAVDFNGDGKDDIASMYTYGGANTAINVFTSTGNSFNSYVNWVSDNAFYADKVNGRFTAGDFNGDGKDDITDMYDFGNMSRVHTFISSGNSFATQTWFQSNIGAFSAGSVTNRFDAGDYNGDGKSDLMSIYKYNNGERATFIFSSLGSSFTTYQPWDDIK